MEGVVPQSLEKLNFGRFWMFFWKNLLKVCSFIFSSNVEQKKIIIFNRNTALKGGLKVLYNTHPLIHRVFFISNNFCLEHQIHFKLGQKYDIIKRNNLTKFWENPTTWRHVTSFLILTSKCAKYRSKTERLETIFLYDIHKVPSNNFHKRFQSVSIIFIPYMKMKSSSF